MLFFKDEWKTTGAKKNRKPGPSTATTVPTTNHNDVTPNDHNEVLDGFGDIDEKPSNSKTNISRGGGMSGQRGSTFFLTSLLCTNCTHKLHTKTILFS